MENNGLTADLLGFYAAQLRTTLEMTQRLLAQVTALSQGTGGADWKSIPMATVTVAAVSDPVVAPPPLPAALPGSPQLPRGPAAPPLPQRRIDRARILVPMAVAKIDGIFSLGGIRSVGDPGVSDGVINRVLEEMIARGELECVARGSGRGGTKYRRAGTALKEGSPLPPKFAPRTAFYKVGGVPGSTGLDGTFWWNGPGKTARVASPEDMPFESPRLSESTFRALVSTVEGVEPEKIKVTGKKQKRGKKSR